MQQGGEEGEEGRKRNFHRNFHEEKNYTDSKGEEKECKDTKVEKILFFFLSVQQEEHGVARSQISFRSLHEEEPNDR